jgi:hypothetical protein
VSATVSDPANPLHAASAPGTYSVTVMAADTVAPDAPSALAARLKGKLVTLSWRAASDNVAVTGYRVSRNGVLLGRTTMLTWQDSVAAGSYTYSVAAYDAAGNISPASNTVTVTISSGGRGK